MWLPAFDPLPGVVKDVPESQAPGRYRDANLVRWRNGQCQPVGGWIRSVSPGTVTGKARAIFGWRENDGESRVAIGTQSKLYVMADRALFDITPVGFTAGREYYFRGSGYGFGFWGLGFYGESGVQTTPLMADVWSFANWGEWLVACCTGDGKLYRWQNNVLSAATVIPNAPTGCSGALVTEERYLMAWGAGGDARLIQWSSVENMELWTPAATNTAGSLRLQTEERVIAGSKIRGGVAFWTEKEMHILRYLGYPYAYGSNRIGESCGIIGPKAFAVIDTGAIWLSRAGFFQFDGNLQPIPCPIQNWFFDRVNRDQIGLIHTGHYSELGEIFWFYPAGDSQEVNEYLLYNYREGHWSHGVLDRTAWLDRTVWSAPIAVSPSGIVYEHETGWSDNGAERTCYAETGAVDLSGRRGASSYVTSVIPESSGDVNLIVHAREYPNKPWLYHGERKLRERVDWRFHGREMRFRIQSTEPAEWTFGGLRLQAAPGGTR